MQRTLEASHPGPPQPRARLPDKTRSCIDLASIRLRGRGAVFCGAEGRPQSHKCSMMLAPEMKSSCLQGGSVAKGCEAGRR